MAKDIALGVVIGGIVGASLGKSFSDTKSKINTLQKQAGQLRLWRDTIDDTRRLQTEFRRLHLSGDSAADGIRKKLAGNIGSLKAAGVEVGNLDREYKKLDRTLRGVQLQMRGRERIDQGIQGIKEAGAALGTFSASVAIPTMASARYQEITRDIAISSGIARTGDEGVLASRIVDASRDSGVDRNQLAGGVRTLVDGGLDWNNSSSRAGTLGKYAMGQGVTVDTSAQLIVALDRAGVKTQAGIEAALGKIALGGDQTYMGGQDTAEQVLALLPIYQRMGVTGDAAVAQITAMLQTQAKVAGSAVRGGGNLAELAEVLTNSAAMARFEKNGIQMQQSIQNYVAAGYDPITALVDIMGKATAEADPAAAKEMARLQKDIAAAQDPAQAQAMLEGYMQLADLGDYFKSPGAKTALLAALQNKELTTANLQAIQSGNGLAKLEGDLAARRDASGQRWSEVAQGWEDSMRAMGDAIRPLTDSVATALGGVTKGFTQLIESAPLLTAGLTAAAGAFVAFKAGRGALSMARGGLDLARGGLLMAGGGIPGTGGIAPAAGGRRKAAKAGAAGAAAPLLGGAGTPVFVTNWPIGGLGGMGDMGGPLGRGGIKAGTAGRLGRAASMGGRALAGVGRALPLLSVGVAGYETVQALSSNDMTKQEKAETVGGAVGGAGGAWAGAAAGAALGSVVPLIGTAIGGAVGGALGWWGGSNVGGKVSGWLFGDDEKKEEAAESALDPVAEVPESVPIPESRAVLEPPPVALPEIQGEATFSPSISIEVYGDLKDPRQVADELMPHLKRMFDAWTAERGRGALFDPAQSQ